MKKNTSSSKRSYMASTQDLLKKQAEEEAESSTTMASLAAEAAAEAAARSEKIRRKVLARDATEREVQSDGELGGRGKEEEEEWREGKEGREEREGGDLKRRENKERKGREGGDRGERKRRREERRGRRKEGEGNNTAEIMAHTDTMATGHGTAPQCPDTPPLPLATPTHQNYHHIQDDYYSHVTEHSTK